jgi:hypothetical protein
MSLSFKQTTLYVTLLSIGGGVGWLGNRYLQGSNNLETGLVLPVVRQQIPPYASPPVLENRAVDRSNPNFIAEAAEKVGPAVVRIDASSKVANQVPKHSKILCFVGFLGRICRSRKNESREVRVRGLFSLLTAASLLMLTLSPGRILSR